MKVISFANQKGGVLKTTLTAQVAYGLSKFHGKSVLAIDLDPQGNLTMAMGQFHRAGSHGSSFDVLKNQAIDFTTEVRSNLRLVPADIVLAEAEMGLAGRADWQFLLKTALENKAENGTDLDEFDYILIDSPPNLNLLTLNALVAADEVIIPITCDGYALGGLAGLQRTIRTVQKLNPTLVIGGVVPCRHDGRRVIDREMVNKMTEIFGDLVYKAKIPESTALKECGPMGKSIWDYSPNSLAAPIVASVVEEFLQRSPTNAQA